jgi:fluoride ion exporter CrcB/FEX
LSTVFGENFDLGTASAYVLITGLAGGLSTFSTVAGQVAELLKARLWLRAVVYGLGSFVIPSTAALLVGILL